MMSSMTRSLSAIANGDVLFVAGVIREGEPPIAQQLEKAGRAAAMLHMWPAITAGGAD